MIEEKYIKDETGRILRDINGNPMPLDHFANDPDEDDWDEILDRPAWLCLKKELDRGSTDIPEHILMRNGFKKIDGKWQSPE